MYLCGILLASRYNIWTKLLLLAEVSNFTKKLYCHSNITFLYVIFICDVYLVTIRVFHNQHFYTIYLLNIYNNMYIIVLFNLRSKAPERFVYSEDTGAV